MSDAEDNSGELVETVIDAPAKKKRVYSEEELAKKREYLAKARAEAIRRRGERKEVNQRKRALKIAKEEVEKKAVEVAEQTLMERVKQLEEMVARTKITAKPTPKPAKAKPKPIPVVDDADESDDDEYAERLKEIQRLRIERKAQRAAETVKQESATEILNKQIQNIRDNYLRSWLMR